MFAAWKCKQSSILHDSWCKKVANLLPKWEKKQVKCLAKTLKMKRNSRLVIWEKGTERYYLWKMMFRRGKVLSVRLYGGIWVLACIALCGATGAHTSELHFLQAHRAIHRGDGRTLYTALYTHACMWIHVHRHIHTHTVTHSLYIQYMCSLQQ